LRKLWRRKFFIISGTVVLTVGALAFANSLTPLFSATSEVLIGVQSSNAGGTQAALDKLVVDRDTIESQSHVVESRALAERVIRRLALDNDPEFNPALRPRPLLARIRASIFGSQSSKSGDGTKSADELSQPFQRVVSTVLSAVDATPADRSHVLEITVRSQSPLKAARIANAFADLYIEQQLVLKAETTERANKWLSGQLETLRRQLDQDERAVEDYRQQNGLYTSNAETVTSQQMGELNTQLVLAESAKAEADAQLGQATAMLKQGKGAKSIPQVLGSPIIQALEEKRTEIEQQAAQLSAVYGPKHPQIKNIHAQISDIDAKIKGQVGQIVASLRSQQTAAQARYNSLKASLDRSQNKVGQTNEQSIKLHELEREADASRQLFQNFLEGYKQSSAQRDFQQPDAWVISHAGVPDRADFPPKTAMIIGAALAGAMLGALLALLAEALDRTFRTSDDVEKATGLPTLAMIPAFKPSAAADHVVRDPTSPFSEAVRKLHTRLVLTHSGETPTVIMMTSSVPDEGKSLLSLSMARLLAYTGRRVIVVDGDLRRPTIHSLLGQRPQAGLVDLLNGEATPDEAVYRDPASGLHAIFAGRVPAGGGYVPDFERMNALLKSLARHYELVILDTPPVLVGSEALHYSRLVDTTIFVTRWKHTSQDVAADAIKQIRASGGGIAGVALAQVDPKQYKRYASVDLHYGYSRSNALARAV
jgi:capsular exopolysaccharide synthesis family protein